MPSLPDLMLTEHIRLAGFDSIEETVSLKVVGVRQRADYGGKTCVFVTAVAAPVP
ncbi:MAG: hypothetical protein M3Q27_12435 [Actinomycetota bacterium]|nr:hypothetical protein [Actinomycetota bacterium]